MNKIFDEARIEQLKYIKNIILHSKSTKKFVVLNNEAGLGKTTSFIDAVIEFFRNSPGTKTLFVQPFKDRDRGKYSIAYQINQKAGRDIALAIDSDNYIENRKKIKNYNVVIITHSMYKQLSQDKQKLKELTEGRKNLVIDEQIDMVDTINREIEDFELYSKALPSELVSLYLKCIQPLKRVIQIHKKKDRKILSFDNDFNKIEIIINQLKKELDAVVDEDYIKKINLQLNKKWTRKKLFDELEEIKEFYNKPILLDNQKLYTFDSKVKYMLLANNIILDASGGINKIYESELFELKDQEKLFDYSNWTIHVSSQNTSSSAKGRIIDFHDKVIEHIKLTANAGDKILVIGNKEDANKFSSMNIQNVVVKYGYFGNLVGKNDWKDFNKVYVVHTPNLPFSNYIIKYQYYFNEDMKVQVRINYSHVLYSRMDMMKIFKMQLKAEEVDMHNKIFYPMPKDTDKYLKQYDADAVINNIYSKHHSTIDSINIENKEKSFSKIFKPSKGLIIERFKEIDYIKQNGICIISDPEIESLRESEIADKIYQAIKRINRDNSKKAEVYIMNSNLNVINQVINQLPNVNVDYDFDIMFEKKKREYNNSNRFNNDSYPYRFIQLLSNLDSGEYRKKSLREELNISDSGNFNRKVLNHPEVVNFMKENNIINKGQKIIIP